MNVTCFRLTLCSTCTRTSTSTQTWRQRICCSVAARLHRIKCIWSTSVWRRDIALGKNTERSSLTRNAATMERPSSRVSTLTTVTVRGFEHFPSFSSSLLFHSVMLQTQQGEVTWRSWATASCSGCVRSFRGRTICSIPTTSETRKKSNTKPHVKHEFFFSKWYLIFSVRFMKNIPANIKKLFTPNESPGKIYADIPVFIVEIWCTCIIIPCLDEIVKYLQYVKTLGYTDEPNYSKCKDFFVQALKKHGRKNDGKLDFTAEKKTAAKAVRTGLL